MEPQLNRPLAYPAGWPTPASRVELLGRWIPVFGWIVSAFLEHRRLAPGERHVMRVLSQRRPTPKSVWGDDPRRAIVAQEIVKQCTDAIGWETPFFIPEDPFEIMIRLRTGDLCEVDAIWRIEKAFSVKFDRDAVGKWIENQTSFGEVVDYILATSPGFRNEKNAASNEQPQSPPAADQFR